MRGPYVILEGPDGIGKSTVQELVADRLRQSGWLGSRQLVLTRSPGSTPLGAHLRKLVKSPQLIDPAITMDELSRQTLFMVDTINLVKTVLEPTLDAGNIVLADRTSYISAIVYGLASGVDQLQLNQLLHLIKPPRPDRLFILQCPWRVTRERAAARDAADHFDNQPAEFLDKVDEIYNSLTVGTPERIVMINYSVSLDDIVHIDASGPPEHIADAIMHELEPLLT